MNISRNVSFGGVGVLTRKDSKGNQEVVIKNMDSKKISKDLESYGMEQGTLDKSGLGFRRILLNVLVPTLGNANITAEDMGEIQSVTTILGRTAIKGENGGLVIYPDDSKQAQTIRNVVGLDYYA